jgi:hypothetical protein
MAAAPSTIEQCDHLLTITHNRYLAAMECADRKPTGPDELAQVEARGRALAEAAELWIQLHELLDVRCRLPLPRRAHD